MPDNQTTVTQVAIDSECDPTPTTLDAGEHEATNKQKSSEDLSGNVETQPGHTSSYKTFFLKSKKYIAGITAASILSVGTFIYNVVDPYFIKHRNVEEASLEILRNYELPDLRIKTESMSNYEDIQVPLLRKKSNGFFPDDKKEQLSTKIAEDEHILGIFIDNIYDMQDSYDSKDGTFIINRSSPKFPEMANQIERVVVDAKKLEKDNNTFFYRVLKKIMDV